MAGSTLATAGRIGIQLWQLSPSVNGIAVVLTVQGRQHGELPPLGIEDGPLKWTMTVDAGGSPGHNGPGE
jgi:hypothetical protein